MDASGLTALNALTSSSSSLHPTHFTSRAGSTLCRRTSCSNSIRASSVRFSPLYSFSERCRSNALPFGLGAASAKVSFNKEFLQRVNLAKLGTGSLWRYCRSFHLASISSNPTKEQLISAVQKHFFSQKVDEVEVIMKFIRSAKRLQSVGKD